MSETESIDDYVAMTDQAPLDSAAVLAAKATVAPNVVYRTFVYETVVLNLNTGTYHGLNRTAGRMLEVVGKEPSVGAAVEQLANEFDRPKQQLEQDVVQLCLDLAERGLILLDGPGPG